jgi:hypothetical protein
LTKNEDNIKDWRSTGRRKARRTLYKNYISYECIDCGVTSRTPPKDAPRNFHDLWPIVVKLAEGKVIDAQLQADHETKDLTDNDLDFINWRCPVCHKKRDSQTEKGETTRERPIIY